MPKCEWPVTFENGLIGVRAREIIENREAYIFVPYKMLFSVEKVHLNPVLRPILHENGHLFTKKADTDWAQLTLILGLLYEMTIGEKSDFDPFVRQLLQTNLPRKWTKSDLNEIQDDFCKYQIKEYFGILEKTWISFKQVLFSNSRVFPIEFQ